MTDITDFNFAAADFTAGDLAKFDLIKSEKEEDLNSLAKLLNQIVATKVAKLGQEKDKFYGKQLASQELESDIFYNHLPCGYFSTSRNGIINKINDTLLDWLGYTKEEIIGKVTWQSLLSVGGKMYFETHYSPLLQLQGFVQEVSFEMVKKDKSRLPILINTKQVRDEEGKVQINFSTVFNVSQRNSYEKELLKAKRRVEKKNKLIEYTFRNASIPIYFILEDASFYDFNSIAAENLGYTREELFTLKLYDLDKDHDEKKLASLWAKLKVEKKITIEAQQRRKDGTLIDVILTANYVKYGDLELSCSYVMDVTEKKKAAEDLKLMDFSFRKSSTPIMLLLPNGEFYSFNESLLNLLGYNQEEFSKMNLLDVATEMDIESCNKQWDEMREKKNLVFNCHFERKDGVLLDVEVSSNLINYNEYEVNFLYVKNVTEEIEAALEKEKLLKELVENNLELKQFSYITSHNLRAPLTNLVSICEIIKPGPGTDAFTLLLIEAFKTSTHHLNETINDLMEVLIIKENKNIQKHQLTFEEIFKKISESLTQSLKQNKVVINTDFSAAPSVIFANAYLESIFLNLLTNAVKYRHPDRDPIIAIKTNKEPNGDTKLTFSDNGVGIDMALAKDKIFGLYKRFHKNSDSKGIGLYLIHSQLTSHGGRIEVESEVNIGTTFTIFFK